MVQTIVQREKERLRKKFARDSLMLQGFVNSTLHFLKVQKFLIRFQSIVVQSRCLG
jgi:hypothetical protein